MPIKPDCTKLGSLHAPACVAHDKQDADPGEGWNMPPAHSSGWADAPAHADPGGHETQSVGTEVATPPGAYCPGAHVEGWHGSPT